MRRITPALLSLIMFVVVGGLVAVYIGKTLFAKDDAVASVEITTIPMALADIPPNTRVTEAHLGTGRIPADQVQPDMLLNDRVIVGRITKEPIGAGSPFRPNQLYPPGYRIPLQVQTGYRAVAVAVAGGSDMISGLITPGQYVDVHLTVTDSATDDRLDGGLTLTLFRGVKVLALNGDGQLSRGSNSVVLELTPMQANIVIQASNRGNLTLSFNPEGQGQGIVEVPEEDRATLEQILGLKPRPEPEPAFQTEDYSGSSRSVSTWEKGRRNESSASGTPENEQRRPSSSREARPQDGELTAPSA